MRGLVLHNIFVTFERKEPQFGKETAFFNYPFANGFYAEYYPLSETIRFFQLRITNVPEYFLVEIASIVIVTL